MLNQLKSIKLVKSCIYFSTNKERKRETKERKVPLREIEKDRKKDTRDNKSELTSVNQRQGRLETRGEKKNARGTQNHEV